MNNLDVWYAHLDIESVLEELGSQLTAQDGQANREGARQGADQGQHGGVLQTDARWSTGGADRRRTAADRADRRPRRRAASATKCSTGCTSCCAPTASTLEHDRRVLLEEFRLVDFARKVVGVGSVGTRAWIALMLGRDGQDPLFLQMKEAEASVLEEFLGPSEFENHGERVVVGPAADAGRERHLPRLAARRVRAWTASRATSTAAS